MKKLSSLLFVISVFFFAFVGLVFSLVFVGMQFGLFNVGSIKERNTSIMKNATSSDIEALDAGQVCVDVNLSECSFENTPEWAVIASGLGKDKEVIDRVANETGVPARLIVSVVVPEQTRFFTSEREVFKRVFEPLKILGTLSQFSLGVSGIKPETARMIEDNLFDETSTFYETGNAELLPESSPVADSVLYARLTDEHNHYYSYLYTALFIKQVEKQWSNVGFNIEDKPGIVATLFNIGFQNSMPNESPEVGGAVISTGGRKYVYGDLAERFYYSDELIGEFSR